MIGRIIRALILIPLAVVLVAFAVANRQATTVSFDPFDSVNPALAIHLPLFVLILALVILGVIVGGCTVWFSQARWRRAARQAERDNRRLTMEIEALRSQAAAPPRATLVIPPAA